MAAPGRRRVDDGVVAVYLAVLQVAVIDAICVWCMVNDAGLVPALGILSFLRLRRLE